jgi:deazaflavin-dependent oxidoreductase (nitroreductase family)
MMKGIPKPLDLALFTREFEREARAAFPPRWLQRLALAPLAWLATHRGYATRYAPMNQSARVTIPRGLIVGTLAAVALVWGLFAIDPGRSLVSSGVQTAVCMGLLVLTARSRRIKVLLVRTVQRWTINPLMRLLLAIGINPLGLAILETRGRSSGKPRRVPVGNGRKGDAFWIIAEHGTRAEYVRNIQQDPRVRVRLRVGLRYRWVPGFATILPDDDPLARQRRIIRWHPLRAFNAINVRVLGADLLTVHVRLMRDGSSPPTATSTQQAPQTPIAGQIPAPVAALPAP